MRPQGSDEGAVVPLEIVAQAATFPHPSPPRGDTFSRKREKEFPQPQNEDIP